jgi:Uma2 family endonuclease
MNPVTATNLAGEILYPDCDGLPMSDNTKQLRWIFILYGNLAALFRDRDDVFAAANLLWYPVEGRPEVRCAPDVFVAFGRPKGDRGSYKQWEEGGVPPTVVFEVLSPSNRVSEMNEKLAFYDEQGVEEYYLYDPDDNHLTVFVRMGEVFRRVRQVNGFTSSRLGIRFDFSGPELVVFRPDNQPFHSFEVLEADRAQARQEAEKSRQEADNARQEAEKSRQEADNARQEADNANQEADEARQQAAHLAELSRKARRGQASEEELRELEQLEDQSAPPSN